MKSFPVIFSILLAVLGCLNSLATTTVITRASQKTDTSNLPVSFSLELSMPHPETNRSTSFSADFLISEDNYVYLKTSHLHNFFTKLEYEDFSHLFKDFDDIWWGIDLWDDSSAEKINREIIFSLRDFLTEVISLDHTDTSPIEFTYDIDGVPVSIVVKFTTDNITNEFSTPIEYSDISDYFVTTFENI